MRLTGIILLASLEALAQAPYSPEVPHLIKDASCLLKVEGKLDRRSTSISGGVPEETTNLEEFSFTVPGRLEQWLDAPNTIRFHFKPNLTTAVYPASFQSHQRVVRPMADWEVLIKGSEFNGIGEWDLHAVNPGGDLIPTRLDAFMRGTVLASSKPDLKIGTSNIPVSVLAIPVQMDSHKRPTMPHIRFFGTSLWALKDSRARFVAQGDILFKGQSTYQKVVGTTKVTFDLDPTK